MTYNKYILWSLVIAIICAPLEQARADFFYDDKGEFTYEGYVFTGSAAVAIIAGSYATYRYLYPPKENVDSVQELSSKYTTMDSAALISVALAAQAMAIMTINCGVEEQIRRPIREKKELERRLTDEGKERLDQSLREKKIIDDFNKIVDEHKKAADARAKQELLDYEEELEWKNSNDLTSFDILTEEQRNQLLKIKLKNIKKSDSLKIPLIARMTYNYSYDNIIILVKEAHLLAMQQGDDFLDIKHINMAHYHNVRGQLDKKLVQSDADLYEVACHEAGHVFVGIIKNDKYVFHEATIESRRDAYGFAIFNLKHGEFNNIMTETDYENFIMLYLAGGIAEQVVDLPYALKEEDCEHGSLSDFISRSSIKSDFRAACLCASEIIKLRCEKDKSGFGISDNEEMVLAESYKKTYKFIKENKENIKKIADKLMAKKTVRGEEVYELLGKRRPKYDFEEN